MCVSVDSSRVRIFGSRVHNLVSFQFRNKGFEFRVQGYNLGFEI